MANARMITNEITADKKINQLSDDTSRLAFTWYITFADCEGRAHGDPAIVRSKLFPRRQDVTIDQMESYIREWAMLRLVYWYEVDGDLWITFVNFEKNQPGLRKDREAKSRIPAYVEPEELRQYSGLLPEQVPVKLKEIKLKESVTATASDASLSPETAILKVLSGVTGMIALPGGQEAYAEKIYQFFLRHKQVQATVDFLLPYYTAWCSRKTKDGRPYAKTGMAWLDWAMVGEIPEEANNGRRNGRPPIKGV